MLLPPDGLTIERHVELVGRRNEVHVRRVLLGAIAVVPLLALLNILGQRPAPQVASGSVARLSVYSPTRLRGGLMFTARFEIEARKTLTQPRLLLDSGWFEGMQVNSVVPAPLSERSANGRIIYLLDDVKAGATSAYYIGFQVDPTNIGRRKQSVWLQASGEPLLAIHRSVTIFP